MLCRLADKAPVGPNWGYEIKFDGIRILAVRERSKITLFSRAGNDLTHRFRLIADALLEWPAQSFVLDAEVVALDEDGRSSFQLLQAPLARGAEPPPLCLYVFDLIQLEGRNLQGLPLRERRAHLQKAMVAGPLIRFSDELKADPELLMAEMRRLGLEGIVAKDAESRYEAGRRNGAWIKVKCLQSQELVIGGFTAPRGARKFFGALIGGIYEKGKFIYVSKIGTGYTEAILRSLHRDLLKLKQAECPFVNLPEARKGRWGQGITRAEMKQCTWVKPQLVCEVHFTEWTRDGGLRHPVFKGLRSDKKASEIVRES